MKNILRQKLLAEIDRDYFPPYVYTYPFKGCYQPHEDWQRAVESWSTHSGEVTLYIHIPFCSMKCHFCDLFTVKDTSETYISSYVDSLPKEMEIMAPYSQHYTVSSIYFGGGTPSLLSISELDSILNKIQKLYQLKQGCEISIEGAPNSFSREKIQGLAKLGFNRISVGVQTFSKEILPSTGRPYDHSLAEEVINLISEQDIPNINVDLIHGLPGQSNDDIIDDFHKAISLGSSTISAYPLVVRDRTPYGKKTKNEKLDNDNIYDRIDLVQGMLIKSGYQQRSLITYQKANGGCNYERLQFKGLPTLSFGAGARNYAPNLHYVGDDYRNRKSNRETIHGYMNAIAEGRIHVLSAAKLNEVDQIKRRLILSLISEGFDESVEISARDAMMLEVIQEEGLAEKSGSTIKLTPKGYKYCNIIAENFSSDEVAVQRSAYK